MTIGGKEVQRSIPSLILNSNSSISSIVDFFRRPPKRKITLLWSKLPILAS